MKKTLLVLTGLVSLLNMSCKKNNEVLSSTDPGTTSTARTVSAVGNTYYVASTGGADTNPGSITAPFATIQHAADIAQPGDIVILKAGTFNVTAPIHPVNSGTSSSPITYKAETTGTAIIDGGSTVPNDYVSGLFYINGVNHIIVDGLKVQNSHRFGIRVYNADDVKVLNCITNMTYGSGIIATNSSNVTVQGNEITKACQDATQTTGVNECLTMASVATFEVSYNKVHDRIFSVNPNNGGEGIDCKQACSNGKVHHNTVYDLSEMGMYIDAYAKNLYNVEAYANTIYNCKSGMTIASEAGGPLDLVKVHDNVIRDCPHIGIRIAGYNDANGPLKNVYIYQNTIARCGNNTDNAYEIQGLLIESYNSLDSNFVIRNNIFYNNKSQMRNKSQQGRADITGNLVWGATVDYGVSYVNADPLFVNASGNNFHLLAGSPAIDKVIGSLQSFKDHDDVVRPIDGNGNGNPVGDLGAYEYKP